MTQLFRHNLSRAHPAETKEEEEAEEGNKQTVRCLWSNPINNATDYVDD